MQVRKAPDVVEEKHSPEGTDDRVHDRETVWMQRHIFTLI